MQNLQAAAYSGKPEAARRLPPALGSLEEQLAALEAAVDTMARAPERFGLTPEMVRERRDEVESLRLEASDVARVCEQVVIASGNLEVQQDGGGSGKGHGRHVRDAVKASAYYHQQLEGKATSPAGRSSGSHAAPSIKPAKPRSSAAADRGREASRSDQSQHGGSWAVDIPDSGGSSAGSRGQRGGGALGGRGSDLEQYVRQELQRNAMREQDEMLGDIEMQVGRVKKVGVAMHEELEQQSLLLGDLQDHVDSSNLRLRGLRKRIGEVLKSTKNDRQLQAIFVLSAILAVLVFTSFA